MTAGRIAVFAAMAGALVAAGYWLQRAAPPPNPALLRSAELMILEGNPKEALRLLEPFLSSEEPPAEAIILAARCHTESGNAEKAISILTGFNFSGTVVESDSARLIAEIAHYDLADFSTAEQAYLRLLSKDPKDRFACDGFARLLALTGRRTEAIPHILRLIQQGEATDLILILARPGISIGDEGLLEKARQGFPNDRNAYIGLAEKRRQQQGNAESFELLRKARALAQLPDAVAAQLVRHYLTLAESKVPESLWQQILAAGENAECWALRGDMAVAANEDSGAIRCYLEAVSRKPELAGPVAELARLLPAKQASPFVEHAERLNHLRDRQQQVIISRTERGTAAWLSLFEAYRQCGRTAEAIGWCRLAATEVEDPRPIAAAYQNLQSELEPPVSPGSVCQKAVTLNMAVSEYPIPSGNLPRSPTSDDNTQEIAWDFLRQGQEIGFAANHFPDDHKLTGRMDELSGGGIAATDTDGDGYPDLVFGQTVPPGSGRAPALIFRNQRGRNFRLREIPAPLPSDKTRVTQGIAVGDMNHDGFEDLVIAGLETNQLWMNNGDGTYHRKELPSSREWTSSVAIADLNGDFVPDIYEVNYLQGKDLFTRLCPHENGQPVMCHASDFAAAPDRVLLGTGTGTFREDNQFSAGIAAGKGLGILVFQEPQQPGLSIFVANDTTANFLLRRKDDRLHDEAAAAGVAYNRQGHAEACMGVAFGNADGKPGDELLVTNFLYESNTLYSDGSGLGIYRDATQQTGLSEASLPVLGFGTQFIDVDLDGREDLYIANGFIEDRSRFGVPFRMPELWFRQTGNQMQAEPAFRTGPEFAGRAVARIDWNLDGRPDLAVSVLDQPSFLLTNRTDVKLRRTLSLTLIGTSVGRRPVGAVASVVTDRRSISRQMTAGDGFQCTNQALLQFGLERDELVREVEVQWPNGDRQRWECAATTEGFHRVIQGRDRLYAQPGNGLN